MKSSDILTNAHQKVGQFRQAIHKVIIGQEDVVEQLTIALLSNGHVLLEGLPGLAKTLTIKTISKLINTQFTRVQFTPDLLPADLLGTSIYNPKEGEFSIKKGPIFTNVLLADEINRAPPKVQSALLEIMAERQVTLSGETFKIPFPFFVLATQNPIEQEGTYTLPEAQTDRFMMKILMNYPSQEEELRVIHTHLEGGFEPVQQILSIEELQELQQAIESIYIDEKILRYLLSIVQASRNLKAYKLNPLWVECGASPRAGIDLMKGARTYAMMQERDYVTPNDIKFIAKPILRHRLKLSYEALADDMTSDQILDQLLDNVPVP